MNKNVDPVKTGKFIADLRKSHNLTQDQLGQIIFITRKSVSKWETGAATPTIDMLKKLSLALGVTMDELVEGEFITTKPFGIRALEMEKEKSDEVKDSGEQASGLESEIPENENKQENENKKENHVKFIIKNFNKIYEILQIIVVAFFIVFLVVNLFTKDVTNNVYTINADGNNFFIKNGYIILSNRNSSFNLGNFYSDTDEKRNYKFTFYIEKNNQEISLITFSNIQTFYFSGKDNEELLNSFKEQELKNLFVKVSYTTEDEEEISFKLPLDVEKQANKNDKNIKHNILDKALNSPNSSLSPDDEINLKFLFDMTEEKLIKVYDRKKINVDSNVYIINYNKKDNTLVLESSSDSIILAFESYRIYFDESLDFIHINNDYSINVQDKREFIFLKSLIDGLYNII